MVQPDSREETEGIQSILQDGCQMLTVQFVLFAHGESA